MKNPDILATVAQGKDRPGLVIGFAAETESVLEHADAKRTRKGADWILANDVSEGAVFGERHNTVTLISDAGAEAWPELTKDQVAARLVAKITEALG